VENRQGRAHDVHRRFGFNPDLGPISVDSIGDTRRICGEVVPVYEYVCQHCGAPSELLLPHARAADPGACDGCGHDRLRRRFSRVAVRYDGWGFNATDRLVADRPARGDFRTVRERAERIAEGDSRSSMHE
jgi:putative FmdB family regulatory protein